MTILVPTLDLFVSQYNYNTGISYETLGPDEVRSLLTTVSNCTYQSLWVFWRSASLSFHFSSVCVLSNVG